jgi:hypothetical protein
MDLRDAILRVRKRPELLALHPAILGHDNPWLIARCYRCQLQPSVMPIPAIAAVRNTFSPVCDTGRWIAFDDFILARPVICVW